MRYALMLKAADQELQSTFLTRYNLKYWEVDQELRRGRMSIFLIRYVLKARGSRPRAPKRIHDYGYIPH